MLFSDITDCEMLVFRCIQESDPDISLVQIMEVLEEKYKKDWKRSTVCTFISHLVEKGYVSSRRSGRTFYYSSAVNDKKFRDEQTKQFMNFWFHGNLSELMASAFAAKRIPKKEMTEFLEKVEEFERN